MSIAATCGACPFKNNGCFVQTGVTRAKALLLDEAAQGLAADEVIAIEAVLIDRSFKRGVPRDGARGGRDLRIHVGGDVSSRRGTRLLAAAAGRWLERGGGAVFTYTHRWREIPRGDFGVIHVLASVERPKDIANARKRGYAAAIVVPKFPNGSKAFKLAGVPGRIIPCPYETKEQTCVECRLCIDADLLALNLTIAFEVHGHGRKAAARAVAKENGFIAEFDVPKRRHLPVVQ